MLGLPQETGSQESKQPFHVLYPAGAVSTTGATPRLPVWIFCCWVLPFPTLMLWSPFFFPSDFIASLGYNCCVTSDSSVFYLLVCLSGAGGQTSSWPTCPCVLGASSRCVPTPNPPVICPFGLHSPASTHSLVRPQSPSPSVLSFTTSVLTAGFSGLHFHSLCRFTRLILYFPAGGFTYTLHLFH